MPLLGREVSVVVLLSALITEPFLSGGGAEQVLQSRNVIIWGQSCAQALPAVTASTHLPLLRVKGSG